MQYLLKILGLLLVTLLAIVLTACATPPVLVAPIALFADDKFTPPETPIHAADVFAVDEPMRQFLRAHFVDSFTDSGARDTLVNALFNNGQLRLDYDAAVTRNASDTFYARAGNCLSLTIMAAALARELGLTVHFQRVGGEQTTGRRDDLQVTIGHVNLVVGERIVSSRSRLGQNALHTIDFMRFAENHILNTQVISEQTILAMYMNNRAAEVLAEGDTNQAYWLARAALSFDPNFTASYITLGVVYRRHGNVADAETVLQHVLRREPANTHALANLVTVLNELGRRAEAADWQKKLTAAQPVPPFYYFDLGRAAMQRADYSAARDLFTRELARSANNHEVHFWLARTYFLMGEIGKANIHLTRAIEFSSTRRERDLYADKRDTLQALRGIR